MTAFAILKSGTTAAFCWMNLQISIIRPSQHELARRRALAKAAELALRPELNLELGAGPVSGKNGWTTVDACEGADLVWDLGLPLPFGESSVSKIYSSHTLEHFHYRDLMRLLVDCHRVLKPGGSFSACVPDASIYVRAYINPAGFDRSFLVYKPAVISNSGIDLLNYIAYMDGHHRYMFDQENLLRVLAEAGFSDVRGREFDPTIDLTERKYESIYAIGIKA
jgi:predicted SAM-dependent methyltransferase